MADHSKAPHPNAAEHRFR
ncbi:hypothetical protein NPIL_229841, partial [Nephila pilipes]